MLEELQPFIAKDQLTRYEYGELHKRAITVIGTGSTPVERVFEATNRYIFLDAPLLTLEKGFTLDGEHHEYDASFAPMASGKWIPSMFFMPGGALQAYSDAAHARGIKARWWDVARTPGMLRRYLWKVQMKSGIDWLNADDLADAAAFLRAFEASSSKRGIANK